MRDGRGAWLRPPLIHKNKKNKRATPKHTLRSEAERAAPSTYGRRRAEGQSRCRSRAQGPPSAPFHVNGWLGSLALLSHSAPASSPNHNPTGGHPTRLKSTRQDSKRSPDWCLGVSVSHLKALDILLNTHHHHHPRSSISPQSLASLQPQKKRGGRNKRFLQLEQ